MFLSEDHEKNFVHYMRDEVGVINNTTLHDAVNFARLWVIEGGTPEPENLWVCFNAHSNVSLNTNHFEETVEPREWYSSRWIGVESSTQG